MEISDNEKCISPKNGQCYFVYFFKNIPRPHLIQMLIHQICGLNLIQRVIQKSALILFVNTNRHPKPISGLK